MVNRYLDLISLDEALKKISKRFSFVPRKEEIPTQNSAGRITAEPIFSALSFPPVHLSAMDGISVKSTDTLGANEQKPVKISDAKRVNTGNIIPSGHDAVIMIEDVETDDNTFTIRAPVPPWQHIRSVGEDIGESEMILSHNHQIRPHDIGALASYGVFKVPVITLSVALIPTGDELVPIGTIPGPGKAVESNMHMAAAYLTELGLNVTVTKIVRDQPDEISAAISKAVKNYDLVIVSAGSSKGTHDYTAEIIDRLGEVFIHGVAIKPAKPVIVGEILGKPVIGMPGYPLACHTILREIITPIIQKFGFQVPNVEKIPVKLSTTLHSDIGTDEFVLVSTGKINDTWIAVPQSRGAGIQMSAVRANAYLKIPADKEGVEAGQIFSANLMMDKKKAETGILVTGSHDPALDYLSDILTESDVMMHSTHVGSMGGVLALKKHECHAAPMHLLSDDGDYNIQYLQKYIPNEELVLMCVAEREQGIVSNEALSFDDVITHRFINRQKGSGTRILFDHILTERGIYHDQIEGYRQEATTHMAVALAVKSGEADLGMCVYSAAKALNLNFVPAGTERYELVARKEMLEDERVAHLFDAVSSDDFKQILQMLGGYNTKETGKKRYLS